MNSHPREVEVLAIIHLVFDVQTPVQALFTHYWGESNVDKVWPMEIKVIGDSTSDTLLGTARNPITLDRVDGDELVASFLLGFMRASQKGSDMNPWLQAAQNVRLVLMFSVISLQ